MTRSGRFVRLAGMVLVFGGLAHLSSEAWSAIIYSTDFSTDPGWTKHVSSGCYWDSSSGRYRLVANSGGLYSYVPVTYSADASYRLQFDLTIDRLDGHDNIFFGLFDSDMNVYDKVTWYAGFGHGDLGRGSAIQYASDTKPFAQLKWGYEFISELNTLYHNVITYDRSTQSITWDVTGRATAIHQQGYVGTFTGIDRLGLSTVGTESTNASGYLDNVVLEELASVPEPSTLVAFASLSLCGIGMAAWKRRRQK